MKITMPGVGQNKQITFEEQERKRIYDTVYNTTRWRKLRHMALSRDGGLCLMCKRKGIIRKADQPGRWITCSRYAKDVIVRKRIKVDHIDDRTNQTYTGRPCRPTANSL